MLISKYKRPKFLDNVPVGYSVVDYRKGMFTILHEQCGKECKLATYTIDTRTRSGLELCTHCNPLLGTIIKNKLPIGYELISVDYPTYHIKHTTCGAITSINSSSLVPRLRNGNICHTCNPPIKSEKFTLPTDYTLISSEGPKRTMKHATCGSTFSIFQNVAQRRIDTGKTVCPICNPLRVQRPIPELLGESYAAAMDADKEYYNITHADCGITSRVHRRTITERLKAGIEPCTYCVPFQRQYSEHEMEMVRYVASIYPGVILSGRYRHKSGLYTLDCYLPDLKLGIEFNGDYFHANPSLYNGTDKIKNKTADHIWSKDKRKLAHFTSQGISIVVVWEYDWLNIRPTVEQMIKSVIYRP